MDGGEEFVRLAYSAEGPDRLAEGVGRLAEAARSLGYA
jgi:hypothetical protein